MHIYILGLSGDEMEAQEKHKENINARLQRFFSPYSKYLQKTFNLSRILMENLLNIENYFFQCIMHIYYI